MSASLLSSSLASASLSKRSLANASSSSQSSLLSSTTGVFYGVSLPERRSCLSTSYNRSINGSMKRKGGFKVSARTAGAAKTFEVEVDKPLGLTLGQKPNGGVVITGVESGGNAAKAGLRSGDQVLYTSSFFGDELWPADKLGFTKTAIQAKPDSVYFVVNRGAEVDVKRLPKRPAPPRFGRALTEAQKAKATHICLDCGYIYTLSKPFDEQPDTYGCPQCNAPKKRFARYDVKSGKAVGGALPPIPVIVALVAGIAGVGALLVYGLQ
ncbi:rubredoxin family protein [Carex rostrata]